MSTITKPRVPDGLRELMKDLTREILKEKPTDIYDFAENYFQSRLPEKENYAVKSFEECSGKYDFSYIQNPQRYQIPVALVYSIIPEGLTNLIKDLIKAILREQPSNLCDFAVEYFRHIKAATCKESLDGTKEINYSAYEKYFMNKERFLFTPYVKCTCGRTLGEAYSNNSQIENLIAIHKIQNYNTTLLSKSLVADDSNNNNSVNKITENDTISYEKYMNSIYIIQRCLRRYLKEKRGTTNTNQVSPNHNTFDHHSVTAEPMITKQYKQTSLIPSVPQLQLNQNESENISEDASYTSASTAVLSASESGRETSEPSMYENIVTKTIMEDVEMENDEKNISSQSTRDHVKYDTSTNNNEEKSTNNVNDGEGTRDINAAKLLDTQNAEFDSMEIDTMKNRNESGEINEQPVDDIDIKDFGKLQKTSVDILDANFESHNKDLKKEKSFSGHKISAENKITEVGGKSKLTKDANESTEAGDKKFRKKMDQTDLIDSTGNNNLETVEKYQILEKVKISKEEQSQNLDKPKDNINVKSKLLEEISQNEIDKVPIRNPSDVFNDYNSHATTESNTNDEEKLKEIKNETVSDKAEFLENIKESNKADKIEEKLSIDSDNNVKKDDADDSVTKNFADFKESTNITDEITTQLNTNDSANLKHEIDIILGGTKKGDLENNIKVTEIISDKDNSYSHIIEDNEMDLKHDKQFDDAIKLNEIDNKSVLIQQKNNDEGKTTESTKNYDEIELKNEKVEKDGTTKTHKIDEITTDSEFDKTINNKDKSGDADSNNHETSRATAEYELNKNSELSNQTSSQEKNNTDTNIAVREKSPNTSSHTNETDKNLIEKFEIISDIDNSYSNIILNNEMDLKLDKKFNEAMELNELDNKSVLIQQKIDDENEEGGTIITSKIDEITIESKFDKSVNKNNKSGDSGLNNQETLRATAEYELNKKSELNDQTSPQETNNTDTNITLREKSPTKLSDLNEIDMNFVEKSVIISDKDNSSSHIMLNLKHDNKSNDTMEQNKKSVLIQPQNNGDGKTFPSTKDDEIKLDNEELEIDGKTIINKTDVNNENKSGDVASYNQQTTRGSAENEFNINLDLTDQNSLQKENNSDTHIAVREMSAMKFRDTNETDKNLIEKSNKNLSDMLEKEIDLTHGNKFEIKYDINKNLNKSSEQMEKKLIDGNKFDVEPQENNIEESERNELVNSTNKNISVDTDEKVRSENDDMVIYRRENTQHKFKLQDSSTQNLMNYDKNFKTNSQKSIIDELKATTTKNELDTDVNEYKFDEEFIQTESKTKSVSNELNEKLENYKSFKKAVTSDLDKSDKHKVNNTIESSIQANNNGNVATNVQESTPVDLNEKTNESLKMNIEKESDNNVNKEIDNSEYDKNLEGSIKMDLDNNATSIYENISLTSEQLSQKQQSKFNTETNAAIEPTNQKEIKIIQTENIQTVVEYSRKDNDIKTTDDQEPIHIDLNEKGNESLNSLPVLDTEHDHGGRYLKDNKNTTSVDKNIKLSSEYLTQKRQSESNLKNNSIEPKKFQKENIQTEVGSHRNDNDFKGEECVTKTVQGPTRVDLNENTNESLNNEGVKNLKGSIKIVLDNNTTSMDEKINLTSENVTQEQQSESNLINTVCKPTNQNEIMLIQTEEYLTTDDQIDIHTTSMDKSMNLTSKNLTQKRQSESNLTNTAIEPKIIRNENIPTDVESSRNDKDIKTEEYVTRDDQEDKHTTSMDENINLTSENLTPKHQSESNLANTATELKIIPNENIQTDVEFSRNDKDIKTEEYVTRDDQGDKHTTPMDESIYLTSENLTRKHQSESTLANTATKLKIIPNENIQTDVEFSRNDKDIKTEEYVTRDGQGDKHTTSMDENINLTSENLTPKHQSESNLTNTATEPKIIPNENIKTDVESSRNDKDIKTEEYVTRDDQEDKHTTSMDENINLTSENLTPKHQSESKLTNTATELKIIPNENIQTDVEFSRNDKDIKTEEYVTRDNPEDKHTTSMDENINLTSENLAQKHQSESNLTNTATEPKIIQNENIQKDVESSRNDKDIKTEEYVTRDDQEDKHTTSMDENINLTSENLTPKHQSEYHLTNTATDRIIIQNENIQTDVEYTRNYKDFKTEEYVTRDDQGDKHTTSMDESINLTSKNLTPKHQSESNLTNTATEPNIIQNENIQMDVEYSKKNKDIKTEEYVTRDNPEDKHTTSMDENINLTSENLTQKHQSESNLTNIATELKIIPNENIQTNFESSRNDKDIKTEEYVTRDDQGDKHTTPMDESINLTSGNLTPKHQSESNLTNTATELKIIPNENIQTDVESSRNDKDIKTEEYVTRGDQGDKHTTSMDESINLTSENLTQKHQYESNLTDTATEPNIIQNENIQMDVESIRNDKDIKTEEYVTRDDQEDKHTTSMDENINLTSENLTPKHQSESNLTNTATELKLIRNENIQTDVESSRSDKDIKSEEYVTRDDQEGKHTTSMDESINLTSETLSQKCQSNFTNTASEPKIIKKESIQIEVESRRNNTDVTTEEAQAQNLHNINQLKASQSETNYSENIDDLAIQNADYNLDEKLYETENEIATSGTSNVPKEISPSKLENKKDNKFESDLQITNTLNKTENSTPINNSNLLNEPSQPISDESCNETCVEIINKKSETGDFVSTTNANKQNNISSEMTKIDSFDANSINISNNNDETTNNEDYPIHDSNMTDELIDKTFTLKSSRAINVEHVNKNIVETLQTDSENSKTNVNVDDTISDTNITDEIITKNCVKESQVEKHTEGKEITYRDDITSSKISSKQLEVSSEKSTNILKKAIKDAMESSENENLIKGETVIRETNEQGDHITSENQVFLSTSKNSQNKYLYESHDHQTEDQTEHIMEKRDVKQLEIGPDASTKEDYDTKAIPLSVENERNQSSELQSGISKHEKSAVNKIDSDNFDQKEKHVDERCNYEELANKINSGEDQELSVKNKTKPLEKLLEDLDVANSDSIKANDDNIETTNSDTAGIITNVGINDKIMELKNDFKKSSSHKIVKQETQIKQIQESQENESENESNYSSLVQVDNQNLKDLNDINEDNRDNQKEVSKQNIVINMDDSNSKLIVEKSINKENDVQKAISNNENIHGDKEISKISLKSKEIETHDDKDFNSQSRNKREAENYPNSEHKHNNELGDTKKDITVHDDDVLGLRDKNVIGDNVHLNEDNNSLGSNMNKLQSSVSDTQVSSLDVQQQQPTHEKNYTSKNETNAKNLASPSFPIQKKSTETNKLKDNQPNEIKKENFNSSTVQNTEKTETTINESSNIEQNISRTSKDETLDCTSKYDSKDKLLEIDDTQEHKNESNNKNVAKTSNINSSIDQTYHCNQQVSNINQNESVHHYKSDREGTQADADDKKPQMSSQDNIKQENTEQRLTDVTAETTNDEVYFETFIGNQNLTIGRIRNFNEGLLGSISGQRFAETHLRSFWKEYVMNNSMPLSQYDYKENEPKKPPETGTSQQQNVNQVNETNLSAYKNEEKPIDIIEPEIIKETIKHSESSPVMNHNISTANNDSTPSKDIERIPRYFYGVPDTEPNYSSSCSKRKSYKEPTAFTIAIGDLNKKQNTKIAKSPKSNKDVECLKSDIKLNLNKLDLSEKEYAEPLLESETPPKVFQDLNEFEYEIHDIDLDITYTIDEIIRLKIENDSQNNSDDNDTNGTSEYSLTPEPMLQTIVELSESETPKPPDQLHSIDDDFLANLERISDTTSTSWTTGSKEDNSFISDEFLDEKNQNEYIKQGHTTSDSEHKTQGGIYEFSKDNMAGKELKSQDYEEIIAQAPTPPNDDPFYGDLKETAAKTIQEAYRQFKQKKLLKPVENISKLKAETESSNKRSNREMLNNKKDEHLTSKGNSTKFNVEKSSNLIYPKENNVKATNSEQEFKIPVNLTSHDGINNFEYKKLEKYVINETILNPTDSESYNKNNIKKIFKNTENYEDFKTMSEIDYSNTKSSGNNFNFESKQASIGQEIKTEEEHNVTIKFSVEKLKEEICNEVATSTVRESSNNIKFTNFNKDDKNNANTSIEGLNSEVFASHLNTESSNNTKDTNIDITTTDLKFDEYDKSQNLGRNEISTENLESPNSNNIRDSYKETAINEYDINDVNSNELANQAMKIDQKSSVNEHIKEFSSKNTNIESSNNIKDTNINVTNTDPTISENNESQNHGGNEYVEIINVTSTENFKGTPYIEMASSTKNIIVANQPIETNIESLADKLKEKFNTEMASSIVLKETSNIIKDGNIDISNKDFKFGLNEKSDINSNDFTNQTNDKTIHDDLPSDHIYFKPTAPAEEDIHSIVSIDSLQSNEILHDQAARKIQKAFKNFIERKFKLSSNLGTFKESLKSNWFVGNEPIIAKKSLPKTKSEISFEETEAYVELTTNPPQYLVDSSNNLEAIDANNFSRSPTAPVTNRSRNSVDLANYHSTNISKDTVSVIGIDAGAIENANTEHSQVNTNNSTNMIPSKDKIGENQAIKYPTLIDQFLNSERHYSEAVNHHNKEIIFTSPDFTEIIKILSNSAGSQKQQHDSVIQYERLEEPCIKKSTSITHIIGDDAKNAEIISDTAINTDNSSSSDIDDTEDSLSTKTVKLHKPDEAITKMQQRRDSTTKILNLDKPKDYNFDEPLVVPIDNLDTDEEGIVVNKLQREETRESSAQSDFDVIIGGNKDENFTFLDSIDIEESFPSKGSLKRVHTIAGDGDSKSLLKNVTIDESIKYIEPPDYELNSGSLCLDNDTAENIRRKMMAYSFSEADSDCFDKSPSTNDGTNSESKSQKYDDFNVSTALVENIDSSTETESTIVSAVTKIQAGARGYLTRKRLGKASMASDGKSMPHDDMNKASFGNAAISESLEYLVQEAAAKRIQRVYRQHYRKKLAEVNQKEDHSFSPEFTTSLESTLAQKRSIMLQRGDALRNDSTPDEGNSSSNGSGSENAKIEDISKNKNLSGNDESNNFDMQHLKKNTSGNYSLKATSTVKTAATIRAKKIEENKIRWLAMRQNSMPVQIDSEVLRVIPKYMRKKIKSADGGKKKDRRQVLMD
ncbi:hypothetical protein FF38_01851 [Lucilia cuprina]|uniref:RIIa domain-containing protein n=1 Tax=Lucilia cuprina TaxID=7375 RepID=A0A0L0BQ40_LUCCU|nr:hypothetical protein FF38_01851 [Lucilia cuprina]